MSQFSDLQPSQPPNPFATTPMNYPPPRRSRAWLWILLGIGGLGAAMCCGCAGMGWFAASTGFNMMAEDLKGKLNADPVAQEHLGTIKNVEMDFIASIKATEKRGGEQVFLFHVEGSKGKADVIGNQPTQGTQSIRNPKLILPGGEEINLSF
jgi:hypothetical protein